MRQGSLSFRNQDTCSLYEVTILTDMRNDGASSQFLQALEECMAQFLFKLFLLLIKIIADDYITVVSKRASIEKKM